MGTKKKVNASRTNISAVSTENFCSLLHEYEETLFERQRRRLGRMLCRLEFRRNSRGRRAACPLFGISRVSRTDRDVRELSLFLLLSYLLSLLLSRRSPALQVQSSYEKERRAGTSGTSGAFLGDESSPSHASHDEQLMCVRKCAFEKLLLSRNCLASNYAQFVFRKF